MMWYMNIEPLIYEKIAETLDKQKSKYPTLDVTTSNRQPKKPSFPSVYVHALPYKEKGKVLRGDAVSSVDCTIQIDIFTDDDSFSQEDIASEIIATMLMMRFEVKQFPEFKWDNGVRQSSMRFNRVIGSQDTV